MPAHSRTGLATKALSFRVNVSEHAEIQSVAADCALSVGEYIRRQVLNKPVRHRFDMEAIAELKRQGGLLKHLHNDGLGHAEETAKIVDMIYSLVGEL